MNSLFEKLEEKGKQPGSIDPQRQQMQAIWEASTAIREKMPDPKTTEQWRRLEAAMDAHLETRTPSRIPRFALALAAVAIVMTIGWLAFRQGPAEFETARGEHLSLDLPDHSTVSLNAESRLTFAQGFNRSHREVYLSGEAYFRVQKGEHPFLIHTRLADIQVLGTVFNVFARDDRLEVTVNEGSVLVRHLDQEKGETILTGNQTLTFTAEESALPDAVSIPWAEPPGWTTGKMRFQADPLGLVCEEIERRFNIDIELVDPGDAIVEVDALFEDDDPRRVVQTLCVILGKELRMEDGVFIIE